jgi:hypothetical protein
VASPGARHGGIANSATAASIQGSGHDGDHQASGLATAATLREAAGRRNQAQSRQAHARRDLSQHVQARGDLRPSTASSSIVNVRQSEVRRDRTRIHAVRHFFGEHGSKESIHGFPGPACAVEVPSLSYAPSELPNDAMAPGSPDRRMVPAFGGGERSCFDAKPIIQPSATIRSPLRPDNAVADDAQLTCPTLRTVTRTPEIKTMIAGARETCALTFPPIEGIQSDLGGLRFATAT